MSRVEQTQSKNFPAQLAATSEEVEKLDRISRFLQHLRDELPKLGWVLPPDFNVFSLLRVEHDEVRHSRVLAWLLDVRETHRRGDLFLKVFLEACGKEENVDCLDQAKVDTEYRVSEANIDVLVYVEGKFLVYIENKIGASEGERQLSREYGDMQKFADKHKVPPGHEHRHAVFLTPDRYSPKTDDPANWTMLSYSKLESAFREQLGSITDDKVRFVVKDWLSTIHGWSDLVPMPLSSKDSKLLVEDWDIVEDIFAIIQGMQKALADVLQKVKAELEKMSWWSSDEWGFPMATDQQFAISKKSWLSNGNYAVWIGVERFTPEAIFGTNTRPPRMYVWMQKKDDQIASTLRNILAGGSEESPDLGDRSSSGLYVHSEDLDKCPLEEMGDYEERAVNKIVEFLSTYARILKDHFTIGNQTGLTDS